MHDAVSLLTPHPPFSHFFFFNDPATTEIYTLSLHDALPICDPQPHVLHAHRVLVVHVAADHRSEEHTSELQSPVQLVCRLLLEKKNQTIHASQSNRSRTDNSQR